MRKATLTIIFLKDNITKEPCQLFGRSIMGNNFGVFLDIDGCLTCSDGSVCNECYQASSQIAVLARRGHVGDGPSIRLCSGRDKNSVELMSNFFGMVNSWMIAEGGVMLFNPTTRATIMNPAITPEILETFRWLKTKEMPVVLKRYAGLQEYLGLAVCCSLEKQCGCNVDLQAVKDFLEGAKNPGIKKSDSFWKKKPWRSSGLLTKYIIKRMMRVETYFNRAINIIPAGVSKGSAVKFLMKIENWDPSWCIAVGDSQSDFPLFRSVGRIGCPSNATEECIKFVKERRGRVSLLPYTRGVLDIINWYMGE